MKCQNNRYIAGRTKTKFVKQLGSYKPSSPVGCCAPRNIPPPKQLTYFINYYFRHGALQIKRSHRLTRKLPHSTISWIVFKIKKVALQNQPIFLLKPVTPPLSKELHALGNPQTSIAKIGKQLNSSFLEVKFCIERGIGMIVPMDTLEGSKLQN